VTAGGFPLGLAHGVELVNDVAAGAAVRWADVALKEERAAHRLRRELQASI
jgi:predicted homoserine dehydrogenase-like protein